MYGGRGALDEQMLHVGGGAKGPGGGVGVQTGGAGERWRLLETVMRRGWRVGVMSTQGRRAAA